MVEVFLLFFVAVWMCSIIKVLWIMSSLLVMNHSLSTHNGMQVIPMAIMLSSWQPDEGLREQSWQASLKAGMPSAQLCLQKVKARVQEMVEGHVCLASLKSLCPWKYSPSLLCSIVDCVYVSVIYKSWAGETNLCTSIPCSCWLPDTHVVLQK